MSSTNYDNERADSMMSVVSQSEDNLRTINVNRENKKKHKICFCLSHISSTFKDNKIITSRYNFLTFLPLNLMLQFSKFANLYFLVLTIMECFPLISDSGGVPVLAMPLSFVVGISMIKDVYEDYLRHRSDSEENNRQILKGKTHDEKQLEIQRGMNSKPQFQKVPWHSIKAGQIVKVHENEYFPCDLMIL